MDDFNRANGGVGSQWNHLYGGVFLVDNNVGITADNDSGNMWVNDSQTDDIEVWATVASHFTGSDYFQLIARAPGSSDYKPSWSVYAFNNVGSPHIDLNWIDAAGENTLVDTVSGAISVGDKIGLRCRGNSITVYKDTGSGWTQIISATNGNVPYGHYIGVIIRSPIDDFGGGGIGFPSSSASPSKSPSSSESPSASPSTSPSTSPSASLSPSSSESPSESPSFSPSSSLSPSESLSPSQSVSPSVSESPSLSPSASSSPSPSASLSPSVSTSSSASLSPSASESPSMSSSKSPSSSTSPSIPPPFFLTGTSAIIIG